MVALVITMRIGLSTQHKEGCLQGGDKIHVVVFISLL
jgi:hypothetical protein